MDEDSDLHLPFKVIRLTESKYSLICKQKWTCGGTNQKQPTEGLYFILLLLGNIKGGTKDTNICILIFSNANKHFPHSSKLSYQAVTKTCIINIVCDSRTRDFGANFQIHSVCVERDCSFAGTPYVVKFSMTVSHCFSFSVTLLVCHASEVLEKVGYCNGEDLRPYENISIEESLQTSSLHRIWKSGAMKFQLPILIRYLGGKIQMSGSISLIVPEFAES